MWARCSWSASLPPKIQPGSTRRRKIVSVTLVGDYAVDFDPGHSPQALAEGAGDPRDPGSGAQRSGGVLADRADSVLLGAQMIVNQQTADQLQATLTALQGTLKATQQHHGGVERLAQRPHGRAHADDGIVPLAQRAARQHARQSGAGPDDQPLRHPHGESRGDDARSSPAPGRGSTAYWRASTAGGERSESSRPTAASTPISGSCRSP